MPQKKTAFAVMAKVEIHVEGLCALNESSETLHKRLLDTDFPSKLQRMLEGIVAVTDLSITRKKPE